MSTRLPLTVLMPVRDAPLGQLRAAVSSTLTALGGRGRIVIWDDGSAESISHRLPSYSDLTVVRSEESLGVAGALNELLKMSTSPFVARMDADDVSLPWRFRDAMAEVERGADLVFSPCVQFGTRRLRPEIPVRLHASLPATLLTGNPLVHSSLVARRSSLGPYRSSRAEDYLHWLSSAADGMRMCRLARPGIAYRVHEKSVTAQADWSAAVSQDARLIAAYQRLFHSVTRQQVDAGDVAWLLGGRQRSGVSPTSDLVHLMDVPQVGWTSPERALYRTKVRRMLRKLEVLR